MQAMLSSFPRLQATWLSSGHRTEIDRAGLGQWGEESEGSWLCLISSDCSMFDSYFGLSFFKEAVLWVYNYVCERETDRKEAWILKLFKGKYGFRSWNKALEDVGGPNIGSTVGLEAESEKWWVKRKRGRLAEGFQAWIWDPRSAACKLCVLGKSHNLLGYLEALCTKCGK